jgi:hypothetical protein
VRLEEEEILVSCLEEEAENAKLAGLWGWLNEGVFVLFYTFFKTLCDLINYCCFPRS